MNVAVTHRYRRPNQEGLIADSVRHAAVLERMGREGDAQVIRNLARELKFVLAGADAAVTAAAETGARRIMALRQEIEALKADGAKTPTGA